MYQEKLQTRGKNKKAAYKLLLLAGSSLLEPTQSLLSELNINMHTGFLEPQSLSLFSSYLIGFYVLPFFSKSIIILLFSYFFLSHLIQGNIS